MKKKSFNLDRFLGSLDTSMGYEMDEYLTNAIFQVSDLGIPNEELLIWKQHGVITNIELNDSSRFNFVDFVRIQMVQQLMALNVPLNNIKKAFLKINSEINFKEELIELEKNLSLYARNKEEEDLFRKKILSIDLDSLDEKACIPLLQYVITTILNQKEHVHLILYTDGDCEFPWYEAHVHTYASHEVERILDEPHVRISLTAIIKKFLSSENAKFELPMQYRLTNPHQQLLERVLSGKYDEILIQFKNESIDSLLLTQQLNPKTRITEIMRESDFMDVSISQHHGRISKIRRDLKIRF